MRSIRDEYAALGLQSMFLQALQFLEEGWDVDNTPAADEIDTRGIYQAGREDVEIVRDAVRDNGVARVVAALGATAELLVVGEDVDEFAFAFIAPLGA